MALLTTEERLYTKPRPCRHREPNDECVYHIQTYKQTNKQANMQTYVHILCKHTNIHTYIPTYVRTFMHTYMLAWMYAYINTYMQPDTMKRAGQRETSSSVCLSHSCSLSLTLLLAPLFNMQDLGSQLMIMPQKHMFEHGIQQKLLLLCQLAESWGSQLFRVSEIAM